MFWLLVRKEHIYLSAGCKLLQEGVLAVDSMESSIRVYGPVHSPGGKDGAFASIHTEFSSSQRSQQRLLGTAVVGDEGDVVIGIERHRYLRK